MSGGFAGPGFPKNQFSGGQGFYAAQSQMNAAMGMSQPLPQFEENVPDDELAFEGKLLRWPPPHWPVFGSVRPLHGIHCCQRVLFT